MPHPLLGCVLRYYLDDFCITHHPITSGTEDEFDVFMDSLIRRISIKMLVSHIYSSVLYGIVSNLFPRLTQQRPRMASSIF